MWISQILIEVKELGIIRNLIHIERTPRLFIAHVKSVEEQVYLFDFKNQNQVDIQKDAVLDFLVHTLGIQN